MFKNFLKLSFFFFLSSVALNVSAQKIDFELLKGEWLADNSSRDVKIYEDDKLNFNGVDGHCFLKSQWVFLTDSTGVIYTPVSNWCPEKLTLPFTYKLLQSPGYGGPMYKLRVLFENNFQDDLPISWDGKKTLKIWYNETIEKSSSDHNKVTIGFSFKKK